MLVVKKTYIMAKLEEAGTSVVDFAAMVGVSPKTMYNVIHGATNTNVATAQTIAKLLDCSIEDLFLFVPEKNGKP
jgi:DNA-binding XRE family transcriptional regulator